MTFKEALKLYGTLIIVAALIFIPAARLFGPSADMDKVSAQQSNTIYKQIGTNVASAPFTSPNVPAIGQSQHLAYVLISNAPSHTCSIPVVSGYFQGSFDNTNFFPLTAGKVLTLTATAGVLGSQSTLFATGLAPYIRLVITGFDTTNCRLNIFYSGSLYPAFVSKMENTKLEGGYQINNIILNVAGSVPAIPSQPGLSVALYGLVCSNSSTADTVTIGGLDYYLAANQMIILPPTGLPYVMTNSGSSLSVSKLVNGNFNCTMTYRYEQ